MTKNTAIIPWVCLLAGLLLAAPLHGQRVRIPQTTTPVTPISQTGPAGTTLVPVPSTTGPTYSAAPSVTLGNPTFDPYATTPNAASSPPTLYGAPPSTPNAPGAPAPFWQTPGATGQALPNTGYPAAGAQTYSQQPPVLFPNGVNTSAPGIGWPQPAPGPYMRLFQDIRLKYTWLNGNNATNQMTINDIETGTTVNFPNFLYSGHPIHVSPVFVLSLWDGPDNIPGIYMDQFPSLPSRVYAAYLDFAWNPMFNPQFGGELDFSMGVFSDFNTVTSDSARFQGTGVFVLNLTPTMKLKGGITYLDRVDIKMLPAVGVLWTPNPQTRWDIYFPRPKLAKFLWTVGNTDVWWYLNGEYGGGSWTVDRPLVGGDKRMDINDIRVGGGLEWRQQSNLQAFMEVAYVFERQIVYASGPEQKQELRDTVMLRGGVSY